MPQVKYPDFQDFLNISCGYIKVPDHKISDIKIPNAYLDYLVGTMPTGIFSPIKPKDNPER